MCVSFCFDLVKCFFFFSYVWVLQGGRFMSTAMYDAREALIPGSVYDRSSTGERRRQTVNLCVFVLVLPLSKNVLFFSPPPFSTYIQHVLPDPRPDRHDWPRPHGLFEHPHPLQPGHAPHAPARLPGPGQRPPSRPWRRYEG